MRTKFWFKGLRGGDQRENLDVEGRILKCILRSMAGHADWIYLAQNMEACRAVVNTEINLRVA